ncbi:MAG: glycosyltransferase [Limnobacter sp.]|uniref:glycosyltransferase n=1 Tax=Limnobacter sp. TaxID=2003368 RepID=UPI0022C39000|nr:glycosyltransferase [Limnobacter sp.]MCZ8016503.1 glycosyltransferase [Limnobacter sp.]
MKRKIAVVTTSVLQVKFFLVPHLTELQKEFDVTLVLNNDYPELLAGLGLPVRIKLMDIQRKVSPIKDLAALTKLVLFFRKEKFDMVHSVNPKAGLLAIVASWLVRVPVRAHIFQGEVWANKQGLWRFILKNLDRLVSLCATNLTVVSQSERRILIAEKVIGASKSRVLGNGSIGGVDLSRFKPEPKIRSELRNRFGYEDQHVVYMYLGRLTGEKGLHELAQAFDTVASLHPEARLHLVGPDEDNIQQSYVGLIDRHPGRIQIAPFSKTPYHDLQVADVLVLPSHREGFGVVIIEAAALGVPAIGSRIYGISDALVEGQTGLMFQPKDHNDLAKVMVEMLDPQLRNSLGEAARRRVQEQFDQHMVIAAFMEYHRTLLKDTA